MTNIIDLETAKASRLTPVTFRSATATRSGDLVLLKVSAPEVELSVGAAETLARQILERVGEIRRDGDG